MTRPKSERTRTLETIESIEINIDDVITALKTNAHTQQRGDVVLRVTPPFEGTVEAHTHYDEPGTYYGDDAPTPIHIDAEAVVVGHEDGEERRWDSRYSPPVKSEAEYLYENEDPGDMSWDEWWTCTIEHWAGEIRSGVKHTDSITFRGPDSMATGGTISIPVSFTDE